MSATTHQITDTFSVLTPTLNVDALPYGGGMEFYEGLEARYGGFADHVLIACHEFNEPWPTWEAHPKGDEIVMLLTGSATLEWRLGTQRETATLSAPGEYIIVPRGAWHTATAAANARMLFITPGEGTENRELPPEA